MMIEDFQSQFDQAITTSGETYTNIAEKWGYRTGTKKRSLQMQLTRWLRHLPKTIESLVLLLDCLGYRLCITHCSANHSNPLAAYQTMFKAVIDETGLSHGEIGNIYAQSTKANPDVMRVTLGRWLRDPPDAIVKMVLLLECLCCKLVIERKITPPSNYQRRVSG